MTNANAPAAASARGATLKASLDQAVDKAADGAAAGKAWVAEQGQAVRSFVRERPVATVGISVGAAFLGGLLVGFLVGRAID